MSKRDLPNNLTGTQGEASTLNGTQEDINHGLNQGANTQQSKLSPDGKTRQPWVNRIINTGKALGLSPIEVDMSNAEANQARRDRYDPSVPFDWANSSSEPGTFDCTKASPSFCDDHGFAVYNAVHKNSNIVVVGGPGTGKTRFINDCLARIPTRECLVSMQSERKLNLGLHPAENSHYLINDRDSQAGFCGDVAFKELVDRSARGANRLIIGDADERTLAFMVHTYMSDHLSLITSVEASSVAEAITKLTRGVGNADEVDSVSKLIYSNTDIFVLLWNEEGSSCGMVLSPITESSS